MDLATAQAVALALWKQAALSLQNSCFYSLLKKTIFGTVFQVGRHCGGANKAALTDRPCSRRLQRRTRVRLLPGPFSFSSSTSSEVFGWVIHRVRTRSENIKQKEESLVSCELVSFLNGITPVSESVLSLPTNALWVRLNEKWEIGKCLPRPSFQEETSLSLSNLLNFA